MIAYPKITVITPSFNQGQYIEETILSVINQNYPNLQYIIIDGGSTDNTVEIIKKYQSSIDYWISEKDSGQSNAINKGLQKAKGEIIAWLNSDDFYYSDTLNTVAKRFNENPNCTCLIGKVQFIHERTPGRLSTPILSQTKEKTAGFINLSQPAMFFKKTIFDTIGPLNEKLHYCFDTELWLKTLLVFPFETIVETNDIFAGFRLHTTSKSVAQVEQFAVEKDNIYSSLANQYGFNNIQKVFDGIKEKSKPLTSFFNHLKAIKKKEVNKVINYYLLYRADQCYYFYENYKAKIWMKYINTSLINNQEKYNLFKLKIKNNYLPNFLIKNIRKVLQRT